jgi:hypothetical protein
VTALAPPWRLRFSFEAARVREAASLSADLRTIPSSAVKVRPAPRQVRTRQAWTVCFDTPPALPHEFVVDYWDDAMRDVISRHPGCRLVGRSFIPIG